MDFSEDGLRKSFVDISAQIASIRAKSSPLRARRDAHVQKASAIEAVMNDEIAEIETPLFDLDQTAARIVRALNGKTSAPRANR